MGRPVLTLLGLAMLLASASPAAGSGDARPAGKVRCLACHPAHYASAGGCVSCHRGNPATGRKQLAHAGFLPAGYSRFTLPSDPVTARGRETLDRSGCRRCHVSGGEGSRLAADLDAAFGERPARFHDAIRTPALQMPDFRFDEDSTRALVNAIYANGREQAGGLSGRREIPVKVHFAGSRPGPGSPPFARLCGPCHRALSGNGSGMGAGSLGPNLTALFTPFHPGRAAGGGRWDRDALGRWAANPRSVRPLALMPPVPMPDEDFPPLVESLRIPPSAIAGPAAGLKGRAGGGIIDR